MSTLGFDNYAEPLKNYLQKYRESIKGERTAGADGFEEGTEESYGNDLFFCLFVKCVTHLVNFKATQLLQTTQLTF